MPASEFLNRLLQGALPRNIRLAAARGLAPLPPDEMFEALVHLTCDQDVEVAGEAGRSIAGWPEVELVPQVQARGCAPAVLEYLAQASQSPAVLEALILNPSAPATVIADLASRLTGPLLEIVLYNRVRLLECPDILASVKRNPGVTPEIARLVQEIEVEFFGGKKMDYAVEAPAEEEPPAAIDADLELEREFEDLSLEGLPVDPDQREAALSDRIGRMTVRQKVQQALLGSREARAILVRDTNRQVARSVLQSPKLSESEIESFSAMRNVSDEILREIGHNRAWIRNYAVVRNLVRNPKTPPSVSQRMLFRLMNRDIVALARDRSVPEAVRRNAEKALKQRKSQTPAG